VWREVWDTDATVQTPVAHKVRDALLEGGEGGVELADDVEGHPVVG
jgi:hypothetical protein